MCIFTSVRRPIFLFATRYIYYVCMAYRSRSSYWPPGNDLSYWPQLLTSLFTLPIAWHVPHSRVHGANMGPIWGRQDLGGLHVGHMNFAIWGYKNKRSVSPLWPSQGLLGWCPIFRLNHCSSLEDRAPVDEIYGCPIFKWVALLDYTVGYQACSPSASLSNITYYTRILNPRKHGAICAENRELSWWQSGRCRYDNRRCHKQWQVPKSWHHDNLLLNVTGAASESERYCHHPVNHWPLSPIQKEFTKS